MAENIIRSAECLDCDWKSNYPSQIDVLDHVHFNDPTHHVVTSETPCNPRD